MVSGGGVTGMLGNTDVITRVMAAYEKRGERQPDPPLGPPRREMVARIAAASQV